MAARRGDLQRPLGVRLAPHIGEVGLVASSGPFEGLRLRGASRLDRRLAREVGDALLQVARTDHLDAVDHGRLGGVAARHHQAAQSFAAGPHGERQHAPHGPQRTVERQLARKHRIGQRRGVDAPHRREDPHGDRQIETRALLAQVGRREVHHHLPARHPLARVLERRADALLALLHGIVREPHEVEPQPARGDVDLDGHRHGVDADERSCMGFDEHIPILILYRISGRSRTSPRQKGASSPIDGEAPRSNSPPPIAAPRPPPGAMPGTPPFEPLA